MSNPQSPITNPYTIFNRSRVKQHRSRASAQMAQSDFLLRELAARMGDRLPDIKKTFPVALDLGAHHGLLAEFLPPSSGIEMLVQSDMSYPMLRHPDAGRDDNRHLVVADEEFLPFALQSFDLVMSVFSLHWINDLPGTLIQINRILKPGGLLMAMMPGGESLKELRQAFEQAELAVTGGLSPRISPFVDVRDAAGLLQRAGFSEPVADSEILTVLYDNPMKLLQDLRNMGEANALITSAKNFTRRSVLLSAMEYYQKHFSDGQGRIKATCEIVTLTGWKQDAH